MTQITTAVIAGAAALLLGYRLMQKAQRQAETVRASAKAAHAAKRSAQRDLGTLVWDERAGVYRPSV